MAIAARSPRAARVQARARCILVVGMHRSGTSGVTRTLHNLGADVPQNLIEAERDNPDGFWESRDIVKAHDRFLEAIGSHWDDPMPIPSAAFDTPVAAACRTEILEHLRRDFSDSQLFVIKDPRLCRLMPIWRAVLDVFGAEPLIVHPVRNPFEVALSLHRRNRTPQEQALALWLVHSLYAERDTRGMRRLFIRYDRFISAPVESASALSARLDCFSPDRLAAELERIRSQWSPRLRHHAIDDSRVLEDADTPTWVRATYDWVTAAADGAEPAPAVIDQIIEGLEHAMEVYGRMIPVRYAPVRSTRLSRWMRRFKP
ncbi:MAG TPA: sulfotransferase [Caulobacteraceae bacterium]|nr:sulfotransferase [Caulobacteraceae bacterium]